jgi:ADP-ribose pyrophosphatase
VPHLDTGIALSEGDAHSGGGGSPHGADDFSETTVDSKVVYSGVLLKVVSDTVRLPGGGTAVREYIHHPGASMVLAFVDDETILLERQFRYPLRRHFIELPAGKIEAGEDPLATMRRELREECGYEAAAWRHLATLHPCIGYADERIELYLARELTHVGGALDDGEFLEVFPLSIREALEWVREGRITEAKAVTGLLWADRIARGEWS